MTDVRNPRTLIGSAIYLGGSRFIGTIEDIETPDLEFATVESGASMKREVVVPVLEAIKATIKIHGESEELIAAFSNQVDSSTELTIRNDTTTVRHDAIEVDLAGKVKVLKLPLPKAGEKIVGEIEINLDVYTYLVNGTKKIEIDTLNLICNIDGKDILEKTRANL